MPMKKRHQHQSVILKPMHSMRDLTNVSACLHSRISDVFWRGIRVPLNQYVEAQIWAEFKPPPHTESLI